MNCDEEYNTLLDRIHARYLDRGYVTENEWLDALSNANVSLQESDRLTERLLEMGVLFAENRKTDSSNDDEGSFVDCSQIDYNEIYDEIVLIDPGLSGVIESVRNIRPPQYHEWRNLFLQINAGNNFARTRLIEMYLRLVVKIALSCHKKWGIPLADTIQEGVVGLVSAIRNYGKNSQPFSTYASWYVLQNIQRTMTFLPFSFTRFPAHYHTRLCIVLKLLEEHGRQCDCVDNLDFCPEMFDLVTQHLMCNSDEVKKLFSFVLPVLDIDNYIAENDAKFSDDGVSMEKLIDRMDLESTYIFWCNEIGPKLQKIERQVIELRFGLGNREERTLEEIG